MKCITYKFEAKWLRYVQFNNGKDNLPKHGLASVEYIKKELAYRWGIPIDAIKVTRSVTGDNLKNTIDKV